MALFFTDTNQTLVFKNQLFFDLSGGLNYKSSGVKKLQKWLSVKRIGPLGGKRDKTFLRWDIIYGPENWRLAWLANGVVADYSGACALYEDGYFNFFQKEHAILRQLMETASDVFDDNSSNVGSGFDYAKQETDRTHIQDIAIRRCLLRMGRWFEGRELIQIRSKADGHCLGRVLSPGNVPFHRPDLIRQPELKGWWKKGSVESFYQSNKVLQIRLFS
jgi:hypothetical protein